MTARRSYKARSYKALIAKLPTPSKYNIYRAYDVTGVQAWFADLA
jgi:hypothetical protein